MAWVAAQVPFSPATLPQSGQSSAGFGRLRWRPACAGENGGASQKRRGTWAHRPPWELGVKRVDRLWLLSCPGDLGDHGPECVGMDYLPKKLPCSDDGPIREGCLSGT